MNVISRAPKPSVLAALVAMVIVIGAGSFYFLTRGDGDRADRERTLTAAAEPSPGDIDPSLPVSENSPESEGFENAQPVPEQDSPEPFAAGPENRQSPPRSSPAPTPAQEGLGNGCNINYGPKGSCFPLNLPGYLTTVKDKCAFLRSSGFTEITVPGKDTLGVDADKNGVGCD